MAKSQYEYVKNFEQDDTLLPECWIVVRVDGRGFTRFCDTHGFEKPNDDRGLQLMDAAATAVMREFPDIRIAYGESDEYSFVFDKATRLFGRRASKLTSLVASCFSATYVRAWPAHFGAVPLLATPLFDARAVCYPTRRILRDYLAWRQVDTHINNLYNTCFWALVKSGSSPVEAHDALKGTQSDFKNELLFSRFGTNYNNLAQRYRKGSVVIWQKPQPPEAGGPCAADQGAPKARQRPAPTVLHVDIIRDAFWEEHPQILK